MSDAQFVATLSDGTTIVEGDKDFKAELGKRTPWYRLTEHLARHDDLHITSLRLNLDGRTIHLPRTNFGRFDMNEYNRAPLFYALEYVLEGSTASDSDGNFSGTWDNEKFVDLIAGFETFEVHYITSLSNNTSWIVVTDRKPVMASTWLPRVKDADSA